MLYELYTVSALGNIFLLLVLLYLFIQDYRKVGSKFSLGLVIFALVLLFNALFSCPIFFYLMGGIRCACPNEVYYSVASIFEFFALLVLLYISTR